jgi:transketolase C-terminal domain/subunit
VSAAAATAAAAAGSTRTASTREAIAAALVELAAADPAVVMVCPDSVKAMRATAFASRFPDRLFDVGIAEQHAVAFAAGLAACGLKPFVGTYAGFLTMRACEQLRTFVAYPHLNVKVIGVNGGILAGEREGPSHQFFEDLGIVRILPGFTVVAPADADQAGRAVRALAAVEGPTTAGTRRSSPTARSWAGRWLRPLNSRGRASARSSSRCIRSSRWTSGP